MPATENAGGRDEGRPLDERLPAPAWLPGLWVTSDVLLAVLLAGWIVNQTWAWVAVTAVVLAYSITGHVRGWPYARQGAVRSSRRPSVGFVVAAMELASAVAAIVVWAPPLHAAAGAAVLLSNVAFVIAVRGAVKHATAEQDQQ